MADLQEIHVGDIGTEIRITLKDGLEEVDVSAAEEKRFILLLPDGSTITVDAIFGDDGSDGILIYFSDADTFPIPGTYKIQAEVEMPLGKKWRSDIKRFKVEANLEEVEE